MKAAYGAFATMASLAFILVSGPAVANEEARSAENEVFLMLNARSRVESAEQSGAFRVVNNPLFWKPAETAVIICDVWDQHWCEGATRRVAELAPRINAFVSEARNRGVLIVHAPSGTVEGFRSPGSLYKSRPLAATAQVLMTGKTRGQPPDPVVWTNTYKGGRVVYTSLGHWDDFKVEAFRRLLINAVFRVMDKPVPNPDMEAQ